jgi:SagB-type dehydrogenase family enzyme
MNTTLQRPQVLPGLVLLPVEDGVLLDGVGKLQVFRGPMAQTILPQLIEYADGTRSAEELIQAFPDVAPPDIHTSLELLASSGLLQAEPDAATHVPHQWQDTAAFFGRSRARFANSRAAHEIFQQLQSWQVRIIPAANCHSAAEQLSKLLHSSCVASAQVMTLDEVLATPASQLLVIAMAVTAEDERIFEKLEAARQTREFSWLRVQLYSESNLADVGPLFQPGNGSCFACFRRVHGGEQPHCAAHESQLPILDATLNGFVALEILSILGQSGVHIRGREFCRFSLTDLSSRRLNYPRTRQCAIVSNHKSVVPAKDGPHPAPDSPLHTAIVFEEYVGLEDRLFTQITVTDDSAATFAVEPLFSKVFQNSPQLELGSATLDLGLAMPQALDCTRIRLARTLTRDHLSAMLALTAGIREQSGTVAKRWSANAGNLGAAEIFVLVHSVAGLDPGLYFYQPGSHSLAHLKKSNSIPSDELLPRLLRTGNALPNALVIFTGAFHRLKKKYGAFAYRLLHLDAGTAIGQLQMVARAMGIDARVAPLLPDDLVERELGLHSFHEQTMSAVGLFSADKAGWFGRHLNRQRHDVMVPQPAGVHPPESVAGMSLHAITEMLFKESRVSENIPAASIASAGGMVESADEGRQARIRLPLPLHRGLTVGEVLKSRRSVRTFSAAFIHLDAVATGLYYANRADSLEDLQLNVPLRFLLLARRIAGLAAGVYEYQPRTHELCALRGDMAHEEMASLFVQDEFADAPSVLWIAGDLEQACRLYGAAGHRRLLLRAGAAGHRCLMAVLGQGLAGCLVAGLIPGAARALLGLNGFDRASLFAVAFGVNPVETPQFVSV